MILSPRDIDLVENGSKTLLVLPRDLRVRRERFTDSEGEEQGHAVTVAPGVGSLIAIHQATTETRHRAPTLASKDRRYREETVKRRVLRCHVKVTARFECFLHELEDRHVRALGFGQREHLYAWWRETFEGVKAPASTDPPAVDIPVLVLQVQREEHRFLIAPGGVVDPLHPAASDPAGYVDNPGGAMQDAGEAPPKEVTDAFALEADQTATLEGGRREQERRTTWELDARVRRVRELSRLQGTDTSPELRVAENALARAERAVLRAERKLGSRAA